MIHEAVGRILFFCQMDNCIAIKLSFTLCYLTLCKDIFARIALVSECILTTQLFNKILLVNALRHWSVVFYQSLNEVFSLIMTNISHMMI